MVAGVFCASCRKTGNHERDTAPRAAQLPPAPDLRSIPPPIEVDAPAETAAAGPSVEPYEIGGEVVPPRRLTGEKPRLSMTAGKELQLGTCIVKAIVDRGGKLGEIQWVRPATVEPAFKAEVLRILPTWRFTPASLRGEAVSFQYWISISHCPFADQPEPG
jgi:hypothetical protein